MGRQRAVVSAGELRRGGWGLGVLMATMMAVSPAGAAEVLLRWTVSASADTYHLYEGSQPSEYTTRSDLSAITLPTVNGLVFCNLQGLRTDQDYVFAVTASNVAGESIFSNEKRLTTLDMNQTPPIVSAGPDLSVVVGQPVFLPTPATAGLVFAWFQRSGAPVAMQGVTGSGVRFTPAIGGTYQFTLVGADPNGIATSDTLTVTVTAPSPTPSLQATATPTPSRAPIEPTTPSENRSPTTVASRAATPTPTSTTTRTATTTRTPTRTATRLVTATRTPTATIARAMATPTPLRIFTPTPQRSHGSRPTRTFSPTRTPTRRTAAPRDTTPSTPRNPTETPETTATASPPDATLTPSAPSTSTPTSVGSASPLIAPTSSPSPTATVTPDRIAHHCTGDCSGDARVRVDELVEAVAIALGRRSLSECQSLDARADGHVSIDELVRAVNFALRGCP